MVSVDPESPKPDKKPVTSKRHIVAREDYLSRRGPAARRLRAVERDGTVRKASANPDNVVDPNGLQKWENDMIGTSDRDRQTSASSR
jgi:hypothetical protein